MKHSSTPWDALGDYLRETQLLGSIQSTLYWDQNTGMPSAGADWRGEQLTLLARPLRAEASYDRIALGELRGVGLVELLDLCLGLAELPS